MARKSKRNRKAKGEQTASLATMIRRFKDGFESFTGADDEATEKKIWRKTVTAPAEDLDKHRPAAKNLEDVLVALDFVLGSEQFDQGEINECLFPRIEIQSLQAARDFIASIAPGVSGLSVVRS